MGYKLSGCGCCGICCDGQVPDQLDVTVQTNVGVYNGTIVKRPDLGSGSTCWRGCVLVECTPGALAVEVTVCCTGQSIWEVSVCCTAAGYCNSSSSSSQQCIQQTTFTLQNVTCEPFFGDAQVGGGGCAPCATGSGMFVTVTE